MERRLRKMKKPNFSEINPLLDAESLTEASSISRKHHFGRMKESILNQFISREDVERRFPFE